MHSSSIDVVAVFEGSSWTRLASIIMVDGDLQRPSVVESQLQRHMSIEHLVEQHVQLDLTRGVMIIGFIQGLEKLLTHDQILYSQQILLSAITTF